MGEFLAFFSALLFSSQILLIRLGLSKKNTGKMYTVEETQIVMLVSGLLFIWLGILAASVFFDYSIINELGQLNAHSVFLLSMDGLLGPLSGLFLVTAAIGQIGASRTSALRASNSLFTAILSVIILRESPGVTGFVGILTISAGLGIVSYKGDKGAVSMLPETKIKGTFIALLSGLSFAFAQIARGAALDRGATPTSAINVSTTAALCFILIYHFIRKKSFRSLKSCLSSKNAIPYAAAGVLAIAARYIMLVSFLFIPVWLAVAIRNTQPLLVLIFTWLFLRKTEVVNLRLVAGIILIMCGIWILIFY